MSSGHIEKLQWIPHCQTSSCGLRSIVELAHLVSRPSVVKGDWTRVVFFCCILRCLLLWVVFSLCIFLYYFVCQCQSSDCLWRLTPKWLFSDKLFSNCYQSRQRCDGCVCMWILTMWGAWCPCRTEFVDEGWGSVMSAVTAVTSQNKWQMAILISAGNCLYLCESVDDIYAVTFCSPFLTLWGYHGGSPTAVRPSDPALCGSCPLVTTYYCRLGDLLCFTCVYRFVCALLSLHVCLCCFRCLICLL